MGSDQSFSQLLIDVYVLDRPEKKQVPRPASNMSLFLLGEGQIRNGHLADNKLLSTPSPKLGREKDMLARLV